MKRNMKLEILSARIAITSYIKQHGGRVNKYALLSAMVDAHEHDAVMKAYATLFKQGRIIVQSEAGVVFVSEGES